MSEPVSRQAAQAALDAYYVCDGVKAVAARSLGLRRTTYRDRLEAAYQLGLEPDRDATSVLPSPKGQHLRDLVAGGGQHRIVIPAAQNATPVDENFRRALEHYCRERDAVLACVPFRYKNPTSAWTASQQNDEWWHPWVADHLVAEDIELNNNLILAASIMVQPTAKRPLSGLQTYSNDRSAVFGHSKIELESVATPQNALAKLLATTGACTVENYTDTKTGKLGEHHHVLGAAIVEIEDERRFHLRHINACTDGSFIDLDREYHARGSRQADRAQVVVMADVHHDQIDPAVENAVLGPAGIVDVLRPRHFVVHDLLDFKAQNAHDERDFVERFRKHRQDRTNVYDEVRSTLDWLARHAPRFEEVAVVESNHNEAYMRWLNDGRGDKDVENAWFYHATWAGILPPPWSYEVEVGHPLEYWFDRWHDTDNVVFLRRNESYVVGEIELGMHGDEGVNGSRGNARQFNTIGVKNTIGHGHGPTIFGGVHQVGVSQLHMRYNERGPSNWLPAHDIQYANGKRTLIVTIDESWCLDHTAGSLDHE